MSHSKPLPTLSLSFALRAASLAGVALFAGVACDSDAPTPEAEAQAEVASTPETEIKTKTAAEPETEAEAAAFGKAVAQEFAALVAEVEAHQEAIDGCFHKLLAGDPESSGSVPLEFTLSPAGAVTAVTMDPELAEVLPTTAACVQDLAGSWRIDRLTAGPTTIPLTVSYGPTEAKRALAAREGGEAAENPTLEVEAGLDRDIVRRIVAAHISEIRYCYNEGLAKDPELAGRIVTSFTIAGSGEVTDEVAIEESSIDDPAVERCVATAVGRWKFPKTMGGVNVRVTYPFVLSPG